MLHPNWMTQKSSNIRNNINNKTGKVKESVRRPVLISAKEVKCCSVGVITGQTKPVAVKPKKTSQSDQNFDNRNTSRRLIFDYCKKSGDVVDRNSIFQIYDDNIKTAVQIQQEQDNEERNKNNKYKLEDQKNNINNQSVTTTSSAKSSSNTTSSSNAKSKLSNKKSATKVINKTSVINRPKTATSNEKSPITPNSGVSNGKNFKQYYKNDNYETLSASDKEIRKYLNNVTLLDPIKEIPESISSAKANSLPKETPFLDVEDENLIQLKEFRRKNYFECHSSNSRLNSKASVTDLGPDHKCVFRFFLNDRLFPEPLNEDYSNTIRCIECNLPLNLEDNKHGDVKINGTIQAKVKLGSEKDVKDIFVILPVKEPLIIRERRKENTIKEEEIVYFGVVKLDYYGNSVFNQTLPEDSLALKYQKGYKEKVKLRKDFKYKEEDECEVIIV